MRSRRSVIACTQSIRGRRRASYADNATVQIRAVSGNARSSLIPHGAEIDLAQQFSAMIAEPLGFDSSAHCFYFNVELKKPQCAQGIAW
jgi:hypothetical protein